MRSTIDSLLASLRLFNTQLEPYGIRGSTALSVPGVRKGKEMPCNCFCSDPGFRQRSFSAHQSGPTTYLNASLIPGKTSLLLFLVFFFLPLIAPSQAFIRKFNPGNEQAAYYTQDLEPLADNGLWWCKVFEVWDQPASYAVRQDQNGNRIDTLSHYPLEGPINQFYSYHALAASDDGSVCISGITWPRSTHREPRGVPFLSRFDVNGNLRWTRYLPGYTVKYNWKWDFQEVLILPDQSVVLLAACGNRNGTQAGSRAWALMRVADSGEQLWCRLIGFHSMISMEQGANGNLFLVGDQGVLIFNDEGRGLDNFQIPGTLIRKIVPDHQGGFWALAQDTSCYAVMNNCQPTSYLCRYGRQHRLEWSRELSLPKEYTNFDDLILQDDSTLAAAAWLRTGQGADRAFLPTIIRLDRNGAYRSSHGYVSGSMLSNDSWRLPGRLILKASAAGNLLLTINGSHGPLGTANPGHRSTCLIRMDHQGMQACQDSSLPVLSHTTKLKTRRPKVTVRTLNFDSLTGAQKMARPYAWGLTTPCVQPCKEKVRAGIVLQNKQPLRGDQLVFRNMSTLATQYQWREMPNGPVISTEKDYHKTATKPGIYRIYLNAINGDCMHQAMLEYQVCDTLRPVLPAVVRSCPGGEVYLYPGKGFQYSTWSNGSREAELKVKRPGTYSVVVTDSGGCTYRAGSTVLQDTLPQPIIQWTQNGNAVQFQVSSPDAVSWDWEYGDGNSGSEQEVNHRYASPGTYIVCLKVKNASGCEAGACDSIQILQNGASGEALSLDVSLSPNPAREHLLVQWEDGQPNAAAYRLYNLQGRSFELPPPKAFPGDRAYLDLPPLARGVYLLRAESPEGSFRKKIVIK